MTQQDSHIPIKRWQIWGMTIATGVSVLLFGVPGAIQVAKTGILGISDNRQVKSEELRTDLAELSAVTKGIITETKGVAAKVEEVSDKTIEHSVLINRSLQDIQDIQMRLGALERQVSEIEARQK